MEAFDFVGRSLESPTKCDALQQNREQVAQANFEMWTSKVGIGVKNKSPTGRFSFSFFFLMYHNISPSCNF